MDKLLNIIIILVLIIIMGITYIAKNYIKYNDKLLKNLNNQSENNKIILSNNSLNSKYNPRILFYEYINHINDKEELIKIIKGNLIVNDTKCKNCKYTNGKNKPKMTSLFLHFKNINVINRFINWLLNDKIDNITNFMNNPSLSSDRQDNQQGLYNMEYFKVVETWGIIYDSNIYEVKEHNHFPFIFSYVYYINVPENSPNIFISGVEYEIKEGMVIIFPANLFHYVTSNNIDNRVALVGNIGYDISFMENKKFIDQEIKLIDENKNMIDKFNENT